MSIKVSLRNSIIEDYRNGIINPDYEVVKTKTKGRYTVRRRKVPLTEEEINELQNNTTEQQTRGYNSIENRDNTYRSLADPMPPTSLAMPKVSKKENALFDLQNQLNAQLLYRINELTDKVSKLKTFKKKVKKDFYENDDNNEDTEHEAAMEATEGCLNEVKATEREAVEQPTTIPQSGYEYMANIPNDADKEVAEQPGQPEPQYNTYIPTKNYKRNKIDYAKFGF